MPDYQLINELIEYAFSESVWISREHRNRIDERYPSESVKTLNAILSDSCSPSELWTSSKSLQEAAAKVEPVLRDKYPDLDNKSINLVLNYACFTWK